MMRLILILFVGTISLGFSAIPTVTYADDQYSFCSCSMCGGAWSCDTGCAVSGWFANDGFCDYYGGQAPVAHTHTYSEAGYYSQATYAPTYSEAGYYSQATYAPTYSEAGYYSQATYYSQASYGSYPDLIAYGVDQTTATAGTVKSFTAVIENTTSIASGAFTALLQRANDASGTGSTDLLTKAVSAMNAFGQTQPSFTYTFPVGDGGTLKYLRVCADKSSAANTGVITESNESNNCGAWTGVSVAASATAPTITFTVTASGPNLTADAITPTSTNYGVSKTFTTTVRNIGTGTTGVGFYNLLQKANDASGTGATDINTNLITALAAGGTVSISLTHTFPIGDVGTKYVRFCTDKQSAGSTGQVGETNETDNCGAWIAVTVIDPSATAPTITFTGSPTSVTSGGSSTLTWSSTNATSCTGSGFSTGTATSGSVSTGALVTTTNYGLSCTGAGGTTNATPVTITVAGACGTPALTFTAAPNRVQVGGSATLTWSVTNTSTACTITGPGVNMTTAAPTSCTIPTANQVVTNITGQSTYTLTCGSVTKTVIVNVVPKFEEF